jgi:hypothetical protein
VTTWCSRTQPSWPLCGILPNHVILSCNKEGASSLRSRIPVDEMHAPSMSAATLSTPLSDPNPLQAPTHHSRRRLGFGRWCWVPPALSHPQAVRQLSTPRCSSKLPVLLSKLSRVQSQYPAEFPRLHPPLSPPPTSLPTSHLTP